jgi:hypothetical protein
LRTVRFTLAVAGLAALCLVALFALDGRAGAVSLGGLGEAVQHQPLATPVKVWRDCQNMARCTGCRPVYRCRSCSYQRTCSGGLCGWGDICVWGPYVRVLPPGARIIIVR